VSSTLLEPTENDATIVAIHEQERAGLDIIPDGEIRRESYSNRFATALVTMIQQAHNDCYPDEAALALAHATVVNAEIRDLVSAGVRRGANRRAVSAESVRLRSCGNQSRARRRQLPDSA
jgi:methionine synthase II (cobalamin-independent)